MQEALPSSNELKDMYISDQEDRRDWKSWTPEKDKRDSQRLTRTLKLISKNILSTGEDYYHAAMILQHSDKVEHYKLANNLCHKAIELGEERAKWLYAATLDRYMISSGEKYQKYGTQYIKDEKGWHHCPTNSETTDEDRAKFNVPPLENLEARVTKLNS